MTHILWGSKRPSLSLAWALWPGRQPVMRVGVRNGVIHATRANLWTSRRQAPALLAPLTRDPAWPRHLRYTIGPAAARPAPAPSWPLLPGTFSALPAEITNRAQYPEPTLGTQVVHFRLSGLDLYDFVLAPCLLGCAGTGRQDPVSTSLCLAGLRYSSACHSIPVTQVF
jgi:hypothetical protein